MNLAKNIAIVCLSITLAIFVWLYINSNKETNRTHEITSRTVYLDKLKPKIILLPFWDDLKEPIDTLAVIQDYYSTKKYEESLPIGKIGKVDVSFDVSRNEITTFGYNYTLFEKPKRNNILGVKYQPWDKVYGINYGRDFKRINLNISIYSNKVIEFGCGIRF